MVAGDAVVTVQQGVFRTNCIDCLDRTNVVQCMLAKKSLLAQMQVCTVLCLVRRTLLISETEMHSLLSLVYSIGAHFLPVEI